MGTLFLITFLVMAVVFTIMAVGVIFGKITLKGSCGGVSSGECLCSQADQEKCDKRKARLAAEQAEMDE